MSQTSYTTRLTVCVLLAFGTSAGYHRLTRTEPARSIMQRLDHSMIYVLVIGTYTPLFLHGVPRGRGSVVLAVLIVLAMVGIGLKLFAFDEARRWSDGLYALMGWGGIFGSGLADHLSAIEFQLFLTGSVLYSLGLPILATRRPDPWPGRFGYHEVWHAASIVAAGLHFAVIASVLS
jgi:hemolysin III